MYRIFCTALQLDMNIIANCNTAQQDTSVLAVLSVMLVMSE